jgi:tetratricopeptide (TPR) repeat protein
MSKKLLILIIVFGIVMIGGLTAFKLLSKPENADLEKLLKINTTLALNASQQATFDEAKGKLELDITDYSALLNLAKLKQELLDYDAAEALYKGLNVRKSDDLLVLNNLASLYYDIKKYPEAEKANYDILAVSPKWLNAYTNLYEIYQFHMKDNRAKLEPVLLRGIEEYPEMKNDLIMMTATYYDELMANKAKAIEYYEMVLKVDPSNATAKARIAELKKIK